MTKTEKKRLVPKLRFAEFKNEYESILIKKLYPQIRNGFVGTATPYYTDEGVKYVQGRNIKKGKLLDNGYEQVTKEFHSKQSKSQLRTNDVLMVQSGHVGECATVTAHLDGTNCHAVLVLTPDLQKINSDYFVNYFYSENGLRTIYKIRTGNTIAHILSSDIKLCGVNIPTLPEQKKIAAFLTTVDDRIEQLKRKKTLLTSFKKGVMQRLFSNDECGMLNDECQQDETTQHSSLSIHHSLRFRNEYGDPYPDWQEKKLGEVVRVNPKSTSLPENFLYVDLESVNDGVLTPPKKINSSDAPSRAQRVLAKGDVLYQMVRPYQKNNLKFELEGDYVASTGFAQFRATNNSNDFIYQLLLTDRFTDMVLKRCTGTSYPAINSSDLADIEIKIPSLAEQTKIANYLSSLDTKIEQITQQITQTQTFKKGLLQQMFV